MCVLEDQWGWTYKSDELRQAGQYIPKEEAAAIADYARRFGTFPPAGITKNQRRHIRKLYGIPSTVW